MIIKQDYPDFTTTELDDFNIFSSKKDPRASLPEDKQGFLEEILKLHQEFKQREVPLILPYLGIFFHKGLDYLAQTQKHSKRAIDSRWPNVDGVDQATDESKIFPLSKRAVFGAIALSQVLELIAEKKGKQITDSTSIFLDCLRFTIPYSGVIAQPYIFNSHNGDPYSAFDELMQSIRPEISQKIPSIEEAILLAEAGQRDQKLLEKIDSNGRWTPVRNAISSYSNYRQENPSQEGMKLAKIIEEAKR